MCWFKKKEPKPDWVTQSREQVAEEEDRAAGTHLAVIEALKDGTVLPESYGDIEWNEYWAQKHQEAAYYIRHMEVK